MSAETLSLAWTRTRAAAARAAYRRLLGVNLALQGLIAVAVLAFPETLLDWLGLGGPGAAAWARAWAGLLLVVSALQLPGFLAPILNRFPNVLAILSRGATAALYLCLGGGFLWLALFDAGFAVALYILYRRAIIAELQTRP